MGTQDMQETEGAVATVRAWAQCSGGFHISGLEPEAQRHL